MGRFSNFVGKIFKVTDIIFFINYKDIPGERHKNITYGRIVVYYRPKNIYQP